jgi:hypothetical protein
MQLFCLDHDVSAFTDFDNIMYVTGNTAGSDTIFIQIYMDAPPGVPGVSKNQKYFLPIKLLSSCAKIAPKRQKLQKTSKLKKKMPKKTCFLRLFQIFFNLGKS